MPSDLEVPLNGPTSDKYAAYPDGQESQPTYDLLATYGRIRCVYDLLFVGWGFFASSGGAWSPFMKPGDGIKIPLVLANLIAPTLPGTLFLHGLRTSVAMYRMPYIWDGDWWQIWLDMGFLMCALTWLWEQKGGQMLKSIFTLSVTERNALVTDCAPVVRRTQCLLYFGAGFWKLNTTFMNYKSSCASIIFMQILTTYFDSISPVWLPSLAAKIAPFVSAGVELGMPILLAFPGLPRRLGLCVGVIFSLLISITPPPNNAGVFSCALFCTSYTLFLPTGFSAAWGITPSVSTKRRICTALVVVPLASLIWTVGNEELMMAPTCIILSYGIIRAICFDWKGKTVEQCPQGGRLVRVMMWICLCLTSVYSFGAIAIGLMDMSNNEMYSSLNESGGSNHLLFPTGSLQKLFATHEGLAKAWPGAADSFGGGIVRVESTSSFTINSMYPGEVTQVLEQFCPKAVDALEQIWGFRPREFAFEEARLLAPVVPGLFPVNGNGTEFVKYTIPALELRRIIAEATAAGEAFHLSYSRPPAFTYPPEATFADEHLVQKFIHVTYEVDKEGTVHCAYKNGEACAPDELAMRGPPTGYGAKFLIHNPHPITSEPACRS